MSGAGRVAPYCSDNADASPGHEQAYFNEVHLLAPVAYFVLGLDTLISCWASRWSPSWTSKAAPLSSATSSATSDGASQASRMEVLAQRRRRGVPDRLRQLRAMGLELALDDFGTGYASLACLRNFDIDYLKIDPSFVHALDDGELALCVAIIALAHKLELRVVAEGVETERQRALLAGAGSDDAQGHLFSPALLPQQLTMLVKAGQACHGAANLETRSALQRRRSSDKTRSRLMPASADVIDRSES